MENIIKLLKETQATYPTKIYEKKQEDYYYNNYNVQYNNWRMAKKKVNRTI